MSTFSQPSGHHHQHYRSHSHSSPTSSTAMLSNDFHTRRDPDGIKIAAAEGVSRRDDEEENGNPTFADELFAPVTEWADNMRWSRAKQPVQSRRKWLIALSYAPDWIITILLAVLLALSDKAHGFRREFSLTDTSLQHTHALNERIPVWLLVVLAFIVPLVLQGVFSLAINRSVWDFHASFLGLVVSHAISITMTNILKVTVGRPRPDIIDRCQPRAGATNAPIYGLVTDAICTNDVNDHLVTDGFRSFPSGHSSTAFAGLAFFSFYLAGKLHLFSARAKGHAAVSWIVFFPIAAATMIAVSRTMDYRHHATDVIAGGLLGFLTAFGVYHVYYPSLRSPWCHKPLAPRIERRVKEMDREQQAGQQQYSHGSSSTAGPSTAPGGRSLELVESPRMA